ncbi:uncharacterized protein VTP21DRAFT_3272 [Calcarisporiella thermophila]|uniref:uncharacterized protein n=1 Tax=Calcarisporiella thermophila TaxID=911321 RepID=UPI003744682F
MVYPSISTISPEETQLVFKASPRETHFLVLVVSYGVVVAALFTLLLLPLHLISSRLKQLVGLGLILLQFALPLSIRSSNLSIHTQLNSNGIVLLYRFLDLYFISPFRLKRPVVYPWEDIKNELLAPYRAHKNPAFLRRLKRETAPSENNQEQHGHHQNTEQETKATTNPCERSWLALVPRLLFHCLIIDSLRFNFDGLTYADYASLVASGSYSLVLFQFKYLLFFSAGMMVESDIIEILACILFNGGKIDTKQFPILFRAPWLATSLGEFWGARWHQCFRMGYLGLGWNPVRHWMRTHVTQRFPKSRVAKSLETILPVLAVFTLSGLHHEYISLARPEVHTPFLVFYFFLFQGVAIILEHIFKSFIIPSHWRRSPVASIGGWVWTMGIIFGSLPWFIDWYARTELWEAFGMMPSVLTALKSAGWIDSFTLQSIRWTVIGGYLLCTSIVFYTV